MAPVHDVYRQRHDLVGASSVRNDRARHLEVVPPESHDRDREGQQHREGESQLLESRGPEDETQEDQYDTCSSNQPAAHRGHCCGPL